MPSAASLMSWGLRWPSPSASTPTTDQVEGMNCIGPTARSKVVSWSYWPASVSVISCGGLRAVERDAVDAGRGQAVVGEHVAVGAAVVGLDAADRGDELPGQLAGGVGGVDDGLGALVGGQGGRGDAGGGGGGDDLRGVGRAGAESAVVAGDRGGRLDGLRGQRGAVGQLGGRRGGGRLALGQGHRRSADAGHGGRPGDRHRGERHQRRGLEQAAPSSSRHAISPDLGFAQVPSHADALPNECDTSTLRDSHAQRTILDQIVQTGYRSVGRVSRYDGPR